MFKMYSIDEREDLGRLVMERWEDLFRHLGFSEYRVHNGYITSTCPIHVGDNESALNIHLNSIDEHDPSNWAGVWKCNTQQCHDVFGTGIIGFTRGMLSRKQLGWSSPNDPIVNLADTINYLLNFLKINRNNLQNTRSTSSRTFVNHVNNIYARPQHQNPYNITREQIRQSLEIPASYYLKRGYSDIVLSAYDVGLCTDSSKMMYNRVVVPIYDKDYNYIGCTGRSIWEKCPECKQYHDPDRPCKYKSPKWIHSKNFKGSEHLYNYNNAAKYIKKTRVAIIVESTGNTWRLEESGLHNSVALFGTSLSQGQFQLLNGSGALSLIILLDNDEAGKIGAKKIQEQCGRLYRLYFPKIDTNDLGDMGIDEITQDIKPFIDKIQQEII